MAKVAEKKKKKALVHGFQTTPYPRTATRIPSLAGGGAARNVQNPSGTTETKGGGIKDPKKRKAAFAGKGSSGPIDLRKKARLHKKRGGKKAPGLKR